MNVLRSPASSTELVTLGEQIAETAAWIEARSRVASVEQQTIEIIELHALSALRRGFVA